MNTFLACFWIGSGYIVRAGLELVILSLFPGKVTVITDMCHHAQHDSLSLFACLVTRSAALV